MVRNPFKLLMGDEMEGRDLSVGPGMPEFLVSLKGQGALISPRMGLVFRGLSRALTAQRTRNDFLDELADSTRDTAVGTTTAGLGLGQ